MPLNKRSKLMENLLYVDSIVSPILGEFVVPPRD